jgi:predicted TIM-barrel fold metal-dependent hydrolase
MIIDANVHVSADGKWFHTPHDASLEKLIREIESSAIDKAIVVPLPGVITNEQQRQLPAAGHPDLIHAYTFNPALFENPKAAAEGFKREFSHLKKSFIKFHNRFGKYHPEDERFMAVMKANNEAAVPHVIGICGLLHDRNTPSAISTEKYFFDLGKKFPETTLLIMHGGGTRILQIAELCRDLHNVFFDLSMTLTKYAETSVANDIKWLCKHYDKRMIWASDFPEISPKIALETFDAVCMNLEADKRKNILGLNIASILNIPLNIPST